MDMAKLASRGSTLIWTTLTAIGFSGGVIVGLSLGGTIEELVGMMLVTPVLTALVGTLLGNIDRTCGQQTTGLLLRSCHR